eukprot:jgi/Botrbrau1/4442/Bobra.0348s0030.1
MNAMSWALYCISQDAKVQKKLEAELAEAGLLACSSNPNPRPVQWDDLVKLSYLHRVIKESLRLYTPVSMGTAREALVDLTICGQYAIPKGTLVWVPFFAMNRSELNWDRPDEFLPDRFEEAGADLVSSSPPAKGMDQHSLSEEKDELGPRPVKRYLPFSDGPRNCAGMSLAKITMSATLATLLGRFTLRLADRMGGCEGILKAEVMATTLRIDNGLWMHCTPRA